MFQRLEKQKMAYIRTGRALSRNGRPGFVPAAQACAALSRRLTLSTAPVFVPSGASGRLTAALTRPRPAAASQAAE